jgi:hypothetical protein
MKFYSYFECFNSGGGVCLTESGSRSESLLKQSLSEYDRRLRFGSPLDQSDSESLHTIFLPLILLVCCS